MTGKDFRELVGPLIEVPVDGTDMEGKGKTKKVLKNMGMFK
jgi:hypothetical protein